MQQCEAMHPSDRWPYVRRCRSGATRYKVYVQPLDQNMDLCEEDFLEFLKTLPPDVAANMHVRHQNDSRIEP